ncbi:MAG: DUF1214 domain-containing protein [bacterium]|nr:hypothetical protein [Deltaproteobacteria bacterium]MCP4906150.1 DUF1214 domain-containing protein [bacterium]
MPTTRLQDDAKEIWEQFCEELKGAGAQLIREDLPLDELDAAEGLRYLSRLLRTGLERNVEGADPAHPYLHVLCNDRIKGFGGDNPDTLYYGAALSDEYEYCLRGDFSSCSYFSVIATGQEADGSNCVTGSVDSSSLPVAQTGPVEIFIRAAATTSSGEAGAETLTTDARTQSLLVRCTFDNALDKRLEISFARVASSGEVVECRFGSTAEGLIDTARFVQTSAQHWTDRSAGMRPDFNQLPLQDPERMRAMGGDPNIFYYNTAWTLAEDESWVIHLPTIPDCTTWGFQINNLWTESLDYTQAPVHLNKSTAHYDADGSVTIVVSERDPGRPNWLRTMGHRSGTANLRLMGAREPLVANTKVVRE